MIRLYRLDGTELLLNVDLISQVESAPDTVITLLSGEKITVKNSIIDVTVKMKAFRLGIEEENRDAEEPSSSNERKRNFPRP
ncbi:MAG: flagellar FlbD family protein [Chrysiogenales bacterium]